MISHTDFTVLEHVAPASCQPVQFLTASDGASLAYSAYIAEQNSPVVILYHGSGGYQLPIFHAIAQELQQTHKVSSYLLDMRGHGRSDGARGDTPSIEQLWKDFDDLVALVKKQHPQSDLYFAGHSSGCGLMLNYLKSNHLAPEIKKLIFIAPFISSNSKTIVGSFVHKVKPLAFMAYMMSRGFFCAHTPAVWFKYPEQLLKKDPLLVNSYTTIMSMATCLWEADTFMKSIAVPVALIVGDKDEYIGAARFEAMKSEGRLAPHTTVQTVAGKDHFTILTSAAWVIAAAIKRI